MFEFPAISDKVSKKMNDELKDSREAADTLARACREEEDEDYLAAMNQVMKPGADGTLHYKASTAIPDDMANPHNLAYEKKQIEMRQKYGNDFGKPNANLAAIAGGGEPSTPKSKKSSGHRVEGSRVEKSGGKSGGSARKKRVSRPNGDLEDDFVKDDEAEGFSDDEAAHFAARNRVLYFNKKVSDMMR
jgi:hypothetical protein